MFTLTYGRKESEVERVGMMRVITLTCVLAEISAGQVDKT